MRRELLPLDPERYVRHTLHTADVEWLETNCAADLWIEVLHTWDRDPVAGLGFTVGTDFDGEQWTMFTYPDEDLRILYGVEVHELNVWQPLIEHVESHLRLGHLLVIDVDAFHLPDTQGVTYQLSHQKTTIAVQMLDRSERMVGYFHNADYAEASGDDFDAIFHLGSFVDPLAEALPPFTALVRMDGVRGDASDLVDLVRERLRVHLSRRPEDNPVTRLGNKMCEDIAGISSAGMDAFHRYAFGTCRQLGANGSLAAAFVDWLGCVDPSADADLLADTAGFYRTVSSGAKAAEFTLARAAAGRTVDLQSVMAPLAHAWEQAGANLDKQYLP